MAIPLITGIALGAIFLGGKPSPEPTEGHQSHPQTLTEEGLWTCAMHPQVRQSEPGACPFCGMDLIPVSENEEPTVLKMSEAALQLANIQTTILTRSSRQGSLRLNGKVKADQRNVHTQTTHFDGRIEVLYKNFEGEAVRKGDKIAALYAPELVAAQEELIEAKKLEDSNPVLLEAARRKLRYWKLTDAQISTIEESKDPIRHFDLLADFDGIVTRKLVNTGDHLHEGEALLEITDLSKVWVVFEVYEQNLGQVKLGDKIRFSPGASSVTLEATVSFISPRVNPQTRIIEVRADVGNRNGTLRPDMLVEGDLSLTANESLLLPRSAVLWTGKRSVVYTKIPGELSFQLRRVVLGDPIGDHYRVEEGLEAGDEIVTHGAFTLDAEAQLKGKISMMNPTGGAISANRDQGDLSILKGSSDRPEEMFAEVELPGFKDYHSQVGPEFQEQLTGLLMEYIKLKDLMVEGNGTSIRKAGIQVKRALDQVDMTLAKGEAHAHWMGLLDPMKKSLEAITATGNRDWQRLQFINLSKALINAVQSFGTHIKNPFYVQFCPMANDDQGGFWISMEEEIINPYFGEVMLHCGNVEEVIIGKQQ